METFKGGMLEFEVELFSLQKNKNGEALALIIKNDLG